MKLSYASFESDIHGEMSIHSFSHFQVSVDDAYSYIVSIESFADIISRLKKRLTIWGRVMICNTNS